MSRITIHVGPPKTATTSLQLALGKIDLPNVYYGGVFQPRERNPGSLCDRIFRFCATSALDNKELSSIRDEIEILLKKGQVLILSEEMFLLQTEFASIESKISNLANLFSGIKCKVLISARPGFEVLPSLYQEIFRTLPLRYRIDFDAFCRSENSKSYDYNAICDKLVEVGFTDILLLEFKDLAADGVNLNDIFGGHDDKSKFIKLGKENSGRIGRKSNIRHLPSITLKDVGGKKFLQNVVDWLGLRKWRAYRNVVDFLDRVPLVAKGDRVLEVPKDVARKMDASYFQAIDRFGTHQSTNVNK